MSRYSCVFLPRFVLFAAYTAIEAISQPKVHTVEVGHGGNFVFDPDTTHANVGDLVVFKFFPTNHSVVRAEYTESTSCGNSGCNPCVPYEIIYPDRQGFNSGNILTQSDGNIPTFNITIGDTSPIWFYCTALQSCHPMGMVGVINPESGASIDKQKQAAASAPFQLSPGQPWPAEGNMSSLNPASALSSSPAIHNPHPSSGAIAGIAFGVLIVILLAAALVYFIAKSKRQARQPGVTQTPLPAPKVVFLRRGESPFEPPLDKHPYDRQKQ